MNPNKAKRAVADVGMEDDQSVFILLHPTHPGVELPSHLINQPRVCLEIGHSLPKPIEDLWIDDVGFMGTLSFNGECTPCVVPWGAVFQIGSIETVNESHKIVININFPDHIHIKATVDDNLPPAA